MFIELFFAAALNMSLPEFQPNEDVSGNVIVSSIDDETKEIIVEEIPIDNISISDNASDRVVQGLSLEHDRTEENSNIESKLDNVIVLQRSILMTLLVTFLYPIIKSCVNLLKGGKDV